MRSEMNFFAITGVCVVGMLLFFGAGSAEKTLDVFNTSENIWNGTWASAEYTLYIKQDNSVISGAYEPENLTLLDPGLLKGNISKDGIIFSGIWTETGPLKVVLSDDNMSYSGSGGVRPDENLNEPGNYTVKATRVESSFDPENIWTGTWKTSRGTNSWKQNGSVVVGSYEPLPDVGDEPGIFEGSVSDDGKTITGRWTESGNFSFTISDDHSYFNGTYDIAQNASAGSDTWNGTKLS